ncbi:hypothetical protein SESBI_13979 [Sesbania bispinosa]|nr:hypothetical protein SESBI_13979 [Sesbania bispinosa]
MDTTTTKENRKVLTETLERWRCGGGRCQSRKLSPPSNEIGKSSEMEVEVGVGRSWGLMAWEMVVGFSKERRKTREKGGRMDGVGDGSRVFLHRVFREWMVGFRGERGRGHNIGGEEQLGEKERMSSNQVP